MASHASGPRPPSTPPSGVRGKGAESAWWNGCVDTMYPIPLVPAGASFVHDAVKDDLTRFRHPLSPPPREGNNHKHHGMYPTPSHLAALNLTYYDGVDREDRLSAVISVSSLRPNPGVPSRPAMPLKGYGIGARVEPPVGGAASSAAAPPTHEMFMNHHRGRPPAPRPQRHLVQWRTGGGGKLVSPPLPQTHEPRPNKLATVLVPPLSLTGLAVHTESPLVAPMALDSNTRPLVAGGPPQQYDDVEENSYGLSAPPGVHSLTLADFRGEFGVAIGGPVVPESSSTTRTTPTAAAAAAAAIAGRVTKLTSKNGAASSPSQPLGAFIPAPPNKESQYGSIIGGKPLFSPTHRRFVEDVGKAARSIKKKRMMNKFLIKDDITTNNNNNNNNNNNTSSSTTSTTTSNAIAATTSYRLSSIAAASGTSNRGNVRVFNAPIFPPAKGSPRFRLPSSRRAPNADNVLAENETVHRQVGGPRKSPRKVSPRVRALEPPASNGRAAPLKADGEIRGAEQAVVKVDRGNKGSNNTRRSKGGKDAHLPPPSHTHTSSSLWSSNRNRPPMDVVESNRSAADGSTTIAPEIEQAPAASTTRKDQNQVSPRIVLKGLPQEAARWRLMGGRDTVPAYSAALDRGPMPTAYPPHRALPRPPLRDQVDHGRPRLGARGKHGLNALLGGSHGGWSATAQLPSAQPSLNFLRRGVRQPAGGGAATHEQHESDTTTVGADPPGGLVFMGGTSILLGGAVMASSLSEYPDVHNMSHAAEQPASPPPPPPRDYHDFVDDEGHSTTLVAKVTIVDAEKVACAGGEDYDSEDDGGGGGGGGRFAETDEMISDAERMELRRHDWLERAAAVPSPSPSASPFAANVESGHTRSLGVSDGAAQLQGLVVVGGLVPTGATFRSFGFTSEAVSAEEEELDTLGGGGGFGYDADNGEAVILRAQREQQVGRGGGDEGTERVNGGVINKEEGIGGGGASNNRVSNQSSSQSPTDVLGGDGSPTQGQFIRVKLTNEGEEAAMVAADVESAIERWSSH